MPTGPNREPTESPRSSLALAIALALAVVAAVGFVFWKRRMLAPDETPLNAPATTATDGR